MFKILFEIILIWCEVMRKSWMYYSYNDTEPTLERVELNLLSSGLCKNIIGVYIISCHIYLREYKADKYNSLSNLLKRVQD